MLGENCLLNRLKSNWELKKVKIDHLEFDNNFIIRGKDEVFIRSLLTPTIQNKLLDLDSGRGLEVRFLKDKSFGSEESAERYRFDLSIERVLTKNQDYDSLIETTIVCFEQMMKLKARM